jgi:PKD repeat protein
MKALLRPLFVGGLSIAIAATSLVGSSSVALGATRPSITTVSISSPVYEGDRPFINATFTDPDAGDQHTVDIAWGDDTYDTYVLPVGARSFSVQKSVPYLNEAVGLGVQVSVSDPISSTSRFLSVTVLNATPSITSFSLSSSVVDTGQAVTATGAFTDGAADTHTVTFNWGDGSSNATKNLAAGVFTFTSDAHTYTAAGDFTVTVTVTDDAGASATATSTLSVHSPNQAPSVTSFGLTAGSEGGNSTLALTFADVDVLDTHTVSVAWGDGSTSGPTDLAAGVTTFEASHVYADTGTYSVALTLADSASHTVTANASVSPANVAPVVGTLSVSPSSVVDHQTLTLSGTFTDPGTADTFTLTVDWGDGTSSSDSLAAGTRSFSATHAYAAAGQVTINATVADRDNGRTSSSTTLVVLPSNHAPADLTVQASATFEGDATTLSVSFTDAEASDTHTVAITWGDGATENVSLAAGATSTSRGHTYVDSGTYTIAVTVTDGGGMSVAGGTTVTATNVSPSLSSLVFTPSSVTDHQTVTVSGTFSDPGTSDTFTLTVAWADGSSSTASLAAGVRSFSASHQYATAGTYDVIVTVTDRDNGAGMQDAFLVVSARNTAPTGLSLSSNVTGLSATVSGSFTDPDATDTHDVSLAWGDGTTTQSTLAAGVTSFSATHTYASAATFTVTVTVADPAGASTSATKSLVTSVPSSTPAEIVDQMSALVLSFNLDRTTERWLLRKLDDLQASLVYGNDQVCSSSGTLNHIISYAQRTLTSDQYTALTALATKLQVEAGCPDAGSQFPKVQKAPTVTTKAATPTPAPKKDTTSKTTKGDPRPTGGHNSQ